MGLFGRKKKQMEELAAATYVCDACGREVPVDNNVTLFRPKKYVCNECVSTMHCWENPYIPNDEKHQYDFIMRKHRQHTGWNYALRHKEECDNIIQKYAHERVEEFTSVEQIKSEMAQSTPASVVTKDFTIVFGDGKYIENSQIYAITYALNTKLEGAPYVFVFFTYDEELPFFFTTANTISLFSSFGKDKKLERYIQLYLEYFYTNLKYPIMEATDLIKKIESGGGNDPMAQTLLRQVKDFNIFANEFKSDIIVEYLNLSNPAEAVGVVSDMGYIPLFDMLYTYSSAEPATAESKRELKKNPQAWFFEAMLS